MQSAAQMFDLAASRAVSASAAFSDPEIFAGAAENVPGNPFGDASAGASDPTAPFGDSGDLAGAIVGMDAAQVSYTISAKVMQMAMENDKSILDILA